nr:MAG TPA: hypothetical protein [Caudoviricetes sp.]
MESIQILMETLLSIQKVITNMILMESFIMKL